MMKTIKTLLVILALISSIGFCMADRCPIPTPDNQQPINVPDVGGTALLLGIASISLFFKKQTNVNE